MYPRKQIKKSAEIERRKMTFTLQISKHGNLASLVQDICNQKIATRSLMDRLVYNDDVSEDDKEALAKLVLLAGDQFNEQFKLRIVNQEKNKTFTQIYDTYNNVKQLIIYALLNNQSPISTVKSIRKVLQDVIPLEKTLGQPFWRWEQKDISTFMMKLTQENMTPHTITTKVGLLGRAENTLSSIRAALTNTEKEGRDHSLKDINKEGKGHIYKNLNKENGWETITLARRRHTLAFTNRVNKRVFFNDHTLQTRVLRKTDERAAAAVLLAYKGVRFATQKQGRNLNDEIGLLKIRDVDTTTRTISVSGECARTIRLGRKDMEYIKPLLVGHAPNEFLFSRKRRAAKDENKPLNRWTFVQFMKQASHDSGIPFTYQDIRFNGEMRYMDRVIDNNYEDPNITMEQFTDVYIKCMETFGVAKSGELDRSKFAPSSTNYTRLYKIREKRRQYLSSMMR